MKYLVGFFLGIAVSAFAADPIIIRDFAGKTYLNAGVGPEGDMAPIRVDDEGHVICSTK